MLLVWCSAETSFAKPADFLFAYVYPGAANQLVGREGQVIQTLP